MDHHGVRPSPVFLAMVAVMAAAGYRLYSSGGSETAKTTRVTVFVFVGVGWIVSLCLHEFAHALVAWSSGDRSVEDHGYLTLDPRRYMNRQLSIVLPILVVLAGGIGLPGGAVMIDRRQIPQRARRSMVSAAGPAVNLVIAFLCGLPLALGGIGALRHPALADALAFLALLEVVATILNALPIPGLDGFGVIAPYLSDATVAKVMPVSRYVFFGLLIAIFYSTALQGAFFGVCDRVLSALGVDGTLAAVGHELFLFWRPL